MADKVYRVKAPMVQALADAPTGRSLVYIYNGGTVPQGQSDEWVEHHLSINAIEEFDGTDVAPDEKVPAKQQPAKAS